MHLVRKILFPFSLLYAAITWSRNKLYDSEVIASKSYDLPVICAGNLNTGGTGKSPVIEYLIELLGEDYSIGTLSRGYKRETTGFHFLSGNERAREVGDEPLQFKRKFKQAIVAVDADRQRGIDALIRKKAEVILLDDAFQHRKVEAGLNILLTSFKDLYVNDFMLPTGNLREPKGGAERATLIVVTKCHSNLTKQEQESIAEKLELRNYQKLFFSFIDYSKEIFSEAGSYALNELKEREITLVTGIANPAPLVKYLEGLGINFKHLKFPDHHNFSKLEIQKLQKESFIITTEKDFVRLKEEIPPGKLYYIPIKIDFIENKEEFNKETLNFIKMKMRS